MIVLGLVVLVGYYLYQSVLALGWGLMMAVLWVVHHLLQILAVIAALVALFAAFGALMRWINRKKSARVAKVVPHIRDFVSAYLAETTESACPDVPDADLKAFATILQQRGFTLSLPVIKREVMRELDRQIEERRVRYLEQAAPDIGTFVSARLAETVEPPPDIPEGDLMALHAALQREGILLDPPTVQQEVQQERERQVADKRDRALERAVTDIRALVGAHLRRDRWPQSPAIPEEQLVALHSALRERQIYVELDDLRERVKLELDLKLDTRIEQAFKDCRSSDNTLAKAWASTYVNTFDTNDEYIAAVTRFMRKCGVPAAEVKLTLGVESLRKERAHMQRVEALSQAMARQNK